MPSYEYACSDCGVEFEELLLNKEEISKYSESHPCPSCGQDSPKIVSSFAFNFKGAVRGTSGVHGNSGVHDWDYPTLDKAVARSSEAKWAQHRVKQEEANKVRVSTGSMELTRDSKGNVAPIDPAKLELRRKLVPMANKALKSNK